MNALFIELIHALGSIVTGIAAIWAACIAQAGLKTWRHQLVGKSNYEVARRLLRAIFDLREEFRSVRSPVSLPEVVEGVLDREGIAWDGGERSRDPYVQSELLWRWQWKEVARALAALEAEATEAEILWGEGVQELLVRARTLVMELYVATKHDMAWKRSGREALEESPYAKTVYAYGEGDEFDEKVQKLVSDFCDLLRPHLR